jgi:hypothetical protein
VNQGIDNQQYTQYWAFTDADKPSSCKFTQIVGNKEPKTSSPKFGSEKYRQLWAKGEPVDIEPRAYGKRYRFISHCQLQAPSDYYHPIWFGYPTIDLTISVTAPEGWEVWVGGTEPKYEGKSRNQVLWHSADLLMPSDHIEIHWRSHDARSETQE